jgi:hypothetical protein
MNQVTYPNKLDDVDRKFIDRFIDAYFTFKFLVKMVGYDKKNVN